jgi:hypothetical protein
VTVLTGTVHTPVAFFNVLFPAGLLQITVSLCWCAAGFFWLALKIFHTFVTILILLEAFIPRIASQYRLSIRPTKVVAKLQMEGKLFVPRVSVGATSE